MVGVATSFVRAAEAGAIEDMRDLMAEDFVAWVTTADGGSKRVDREQYLDSVRQMDVGSASLRLTVPDSVLVEPGLVLLLVEVRAERGGRSLHNHSGQLARIRDGRIGELWMVDALPAESDAFWAQP